MPVPLETHLTHPRTPLEHTIAGLGPWFHNLHLPDGTQTAPDHPLGDFPRFKWQQVAPHLPSDLRGWRVLDIGCNAGFYCFELARRGASVTGINVEERYLRQARWAVEQYGLAEPVMFEHKQVYDLAHSEITYDLIVFMGVFYHLRYPYHAAVEAMVRASGLRVISRPGHEIYLCEPGPHCPRKHVIPMQRSSPLPPEDCMNDKARSNS